MQITINIPQEVYEHILKAKSVPDVLGIDMVTAINAIKNGIPVNADTLAHMIINERIYGDFKQDICYEESVIDEVKCRLELKIIDLRPCYCSAGLRETWRDKNNKKN